MSARNDSDSVGSGPGALVRDGKLPLPDDYFRTPKLNSKETKYLINLAKRACKEVVFYSRRTGGPMNWVHLSSDDGVEVFQGVDESAVSENKSITYLRGATRIYASIDDVADFFRLDTPMKLSGFTQTVGKDLLDQKTLYDLALPSAENPKHYVGVKWTAVESPSKLARNRDFCYLECHDEFIDTNSKKRGWVRSLHSIRLPFCPLLNKSHGLVRGSLYRSGFVFIESDDKTYVDAVHTLHMDIKGNAPNWLKIMVMKRRIKNISEVNRYFQMRRLCEGRLLSDLELPSKSGVSKCQICNHRFGLFSRKSGCRKCGKVICSACGHHFILDYAGVGAKKVKICAHCSDRVVHGDEGSEHRPMSHLGGHRLDTLPRPIYDASPSSRGTRSQSRVARQHSAEEREYYMNNEDDRGMADIEEAKRMNREFEEHFTQSAVAQQQQAARAPSGMPPIGRGANGSSGNRRQSQRGVAFEGHHNRDPFAEPDPALSRKQSKQTLSAYQEFLKNERVRKKSIGVTVAETTRGPSNRKSFVQAGAPAPGEVLSRARHNQGKGRFSSNSTELEFAMPPAPEENLETIRIGSDYEPDYEYPLSKLQRLQENVSVLSDDTVGAPIRRSDLSTGRSSRVSSSDALHTSEVDREMLPDEVARRGHAATLPRSYPSPTSTDSFSKNGSSIVYTQRPSYSVGPSTQHRSGGNSEFQEFRRSYFNARNSDIDELQERIQSAPGTDDEGDFRYGYDAASAVSDDTDFNDKEYEVPVSAESVARLSRRNTVTEKPPVKRDQVENLATVMALSAMQLYEKENGMDLQVSEETRQAALKKMVEIYSNELERNHGDEQFTGRRMTRSASVTAPSANGAFVSGKKDSFYRVDRQHAQTMMSHSPYSPEYRDLSDLSASAFKAYQKGNMTEDTSSDPRSDAEPSLPSSTSRTSRQQTFGPESKSSSSRNAQLRTEDSTHGANSTHRGSLPNSEGHVRPSPRHNSARDDVSDTFSELDLIDLPHLMRADDAVTAERHSVERLSHESHQTTFSEISSIDPGQPRQSDLGVNDTTNRGSYASLHAEPGLHSPPSGRRSDSISSLSESDYNDEGDFTSRTKMTQSELERYRASLAELMAEYNQEHNRDSLTRALQPEREPDFRTYSQRAANHKSPNARAPPQPNLEHVLQELYL